jgi:Zn-dependent metalloprotease
MYHRNPIFCILPPHMLKEIAQNGSEKQKDMAVKTMITSEKMRDQRESTPETVSFAAPGATTTKNRLIYDEKQGSSLPGTLVRSEGDPPSSDVGVNEAYDYSGATYDFYSDIFSRNSVDGNGLTLKSSVHYQKGYDNAFWNGQQMVYGDGDEDLPIAQRLFNRFTISMDVIGHELTHGVTQFEANLTYNQQSGALNESFSDVFGSLVKQYKLGQTADQADWIIGQGLFTPNVKGVGIRSMKAPGTAYNDPVLGKDPQPANMKDYNNTVSDNGGVHINSGIPNHAFYLIATELGGNAWEKAGLIWYTTLKDKLQSNSNFQNCADLTYLVAGEKFGAGSLEQKAVLKGWADVGITVDTSSAPPPPPTGDGCLTALFSKLGILARERSK